MKKTALLLFITLASVIAFAHEFWLAPHKFFFTIREVANIRFQSGIPLRGANWAGNRDHIQQLFHYSPSGAYTDLSAVLSLKKGDSVQLPLREEGTHMVIFNSRNSFTNAEAEKFQADLKEMGLNEAIKYREQHQEDKLPGKEYIQHSIKTIFQVGGKLTDDCLLPTSLPLDILPLENPYAVPLGSNREAPVKVRFQVLFNKMPLYNVLVKVTYSTSQQTIKTEEYRTNRRGLITAERRPGSYMVSCAYMVRNDPDTSAQWQRYAGSLSFEYSQFFPGNTGR